MAKEKATETAKETVDTKKQNEVAVKEETKNEVTPFSGYDLSELGFSEDELKELTGMESIDSSEISIPYASLISKATREYELGDIVFPDGTVVKGAKGETVKGLAVLNVQPVRVYFPQPFNPKNSFICRSLDGKVGAPDGEFAGRECATCEFAQYPEAGGASPCRDQRLLLCTLEDGTLFHLQISGVGMKVWKTFMSAQAFSLLSKVNHILGALNIEVGVKNIDTDFGPFPALDFKIPKSQPFHDKNRLVESLTALKTYKEFAREHASTAAHQTRVQMAAEESIEATGENKELF